MAVPPERVSVAAAQPTIPRSQLLPSTVTLSTPNLAHETAREPFEYVWLHGQGLDEQQVTAIEVSSSASPHALLLG